MNRENYYLEPLIHRWKNHYFGADYALFEFKDLKKCTLKTKEVNTDDLKTNFTESFFNSWKDAVDNWKKVFKSEKGLIENGKILADSFSVLELLNSYKTHIKVADCYENEEKYKKYIEDNKHLYSIVDYYKSGFMYSLDYLPEELKKNINKEKVLSENCYFIREKLPGLDGTIIYPFRATYGDNLVLFMDFFEELKEFWKSNFPDAIKVIIKRNSLKRFFGITEINPNTNYYFSSVGMGESQFLDCTIEYFFLFKDGTIKGWNNQK
jgi:hypothetical protein